MACLGSPTRVAEEQIGQLDQKAQPDSISRDSAAHPDATLGPPGMVSRPVPAPARGDRGGPDPRGGPPQGAVPRHLSPRHAGELPPAAWARRTMAIGAVEPDFVGRRFLAALGFVGEPIAFDD